MSNYFNEKEWRDLLDDVNAGNVVPVIGPALVTVNHSDGKSLPLYSALAPQLAAELELPEPERYTTAAQVAATYVLSGKGRSQVYRELRALLRTVDPSNGASIISPALQQLARIKSFFLYIGVTPDHHMIHALDTHRPGFDASRHVIAFHPNEPPEERDLPSARLRGPEVYLYQLLGDQDPRQCRDFAVWEEDLMEYICGLLEHSDQIKNLFSVLRERSLLFLGAPADDWIVRFLLRAVRGERLSNRKRDQSSEYIAYENNAFTQTTVLFFNKAVQTARLIGGSPADFVDELFNRWQQTYNIDQNDQRLFDSLPTEMPSGAVFISYATEDRAVALNIARALHAERVPFWIDRRDLQAGHRYDEILEAEIKLHSSLFIALITRSSESSPDRYVQNERRWAASRQGDLYDEFYLPVLHGLQVKDVRFEPESVHKRHFHTLTPDNLGEFARRVRKLHEQRRGA